MPVIQVDWLVGRDNEQKEKLFLGITKAFEDIGVKKETLHIIIRDVPKENWANDGVSYAKKGHQH